MIQNSILPKYIRSKSSETCYGCLACVEVCPTSALSNIKDAEGFYYPAFNEEQCIQCGKCRNVCPYEGELKNRVEKQEVYYAWSNNKNIRLNSSSGGVFSEIALKVIHKGGIVYGAEYTNKMDVVHSRVSNKDGLIKLRGSKYVQSNIKDVFSLLKEDLKTGKLVYFVGTPCQISAVKKYTSNPNNLITSDLVCHGVPSNQMFQDQMDLFSGEVKSVNFRDKKRTGWGYDINIKSKSNELTMEPITLPYFYGFWKNLTLRPSCYSCQFSTTNREGDITLADYWLVKKSHPKLKTGKGVSAIIVNTSKGNEILKQIEGLFVDQSSMPNLLKGLGRLKSPVKKPVNRGVIMKEYSEKGFNFIASKYLTPKQKDIFIEKMMRKIKQLILFKYWK